MDPEIRRTPLALLAATPIAETIWTRSSRWHARRHACGTEDIQCTGGVQESVSVVTGVDRVIQPRRHFDTYKIGRKDILPLADLVSANASATGIAPLT